MNLTKTFSAFSLAFALIGGAIVLTPSSADAAARKKSRYISYEAMKGNRAPAPSWSGKRPGQKPYRRSCTQQTRCARG